MKEEKQKKFEEFYIKFLKKCLTENMLPTPLIRYEKNGIYPVIDAVEVDEEKKKEILSSLEKSSK